MGIFDNLLQIDLKKDMGMVGLTDDFFAVVVNNIFVKENKDVLIVVNSLYEANNIYNNLINFTDDVYLFPMDDFLTSEAISISPDLQISRLETLNRCLINKPKIIITNLMGYLRYLPTKKCYSDSEIILKIGEEINSTKLVERLINIGYKRDSIVSRTGEFAVRGFVIDIFPIGYENALRVEFFEDEIDSIRYFDVDTQKSIENINNINIFPCSEFISSSPVAEEDFGKNKNLYKYGEVSSISKYIDGYVIFKDYKQLVTAYTNIMEEAIQYKATKDINYNGNYMFNINEIVNDFVLNYSSIDNIMSENVLNFNIKTIGHFNEDEYRINNYIRSEIDNGKTILICLKDYNLRTLRKKLDMPVYDVSDNSYKINKVNMIPFPISGGFIYDDLIVLSEKELFNNYTKKKKYNTKFKYSVSIGDINKLSIGDYIVHNVHGIGIYNGIKTLTMKDITKDYLEILYAGSDKVYIPVEKIDSIFKYSGKEGMVPKINKLGSLDWEKTKARVRNKVNDMADRLLKLYAERESKVGFAFSADDKMMIDFENDFPYELTKDQITSISQIKSDMESKHPMDRLLCGDVGFGKTEVAFTAAFKAINDSKQVLFLCPTTILSNQHFENAVERFKKYPVNIALLNRFTSAKEVKKILEELSNGTLDMLIGTHRLLSDDIKPKDLGLLIIDEEQRFGVSHKEKLKEMKTNVDVLTLSATPIPRTLQMSLTGIKSLSLIETPPVNRFPVQTYVVEENDQLIRDAIYKEMSREGQTFLLYNNIQNIEEEATKIRKLVPDARVAIAHGRMTKNEIENTILDFVNGLFDVLVCTTIIETGIDIPNVNTLIIIDADRFGLSQLYQIRGRVGRSDKFAYAYLFYKPYKMLSDIAVKRLNVIKEFTELGSGFSIATRDLSIRGAGDMLGSEQAGFIDSVGIDLYLKMLNEEINKRNNREEVLEDVSTKPLINVTTHISSDYVFEDELKIEIHKKINEINSLDKLNVVRNELEDRFGKVSEDIIIYMYEEWFEKIAKSIGIKTVNQNKNSIEVLLPSEVISKLNMDEVFIDAFNVTKMFRFLSKKSDVVIVLDIIKLDNHPIYYLVELFNKIKEKLEKGLTK